MTDKQDCPLCGHRQIDEYTHSDCPPDSTPDDHRHWGCGNRACEHGWVEPVLAIVTPETVGS